jgi:transcriptional regulator with XRE-family HTH domain
VNHTRWRLSRERRAAEGHVEPPEVIAEREQIRLALELGQLVYDRRTALKLTQAALGEGLGMTADEVEAIERGGLLPLTADFLGILPEVFPWVRFLPEADIRAFAIELVDTMRAADSVGNSASVAQLLIAWQHTAEVHSDPELLTALTRDHGEDYGLAADPRDRA